jgi:hypothetical protein
VWSPSFPPSTELSASERAPLEPRRLGRGFVVATVHMRSWGGSSLSRTWWPVAASVCVGAGVMWFVGDGEPSFDTAPPAGASASAPPSTQPPPVDEVLAAIEIETGLTTGQVMACDTAGGRATGFYPAAEACAPEDRGVIGEGVTYGIVLENTSDQALIGVPLTYRFLDGAGEVVPEPATPFSDRDLTAEEARIDVLGPGERFGFSGMRYRDRPGTQRVEVVVGEPEMWMPEAEFVLMFAGAVAPSEALSGEDIQVSYGSQNQPIVSLSVTSSVDQALDRPMVYAVLRDGAGRIVGGDGAMLNEVIEGHTSVPAEIAVDDPLEVPGIDPRRVEVYFSQFAV